MIIYIGARGDVFSHNPPTRSQINSIHWITLYGNMCVLVSYRVHAVTVYYWLYLFKWEHIHRSAWWTLVSPLVGDRWTPVWPKARHGAACHQQDLQADPGGPVGYRQFSQQFECKRFYIRLLFRTYRPIQEFVSVNEWVSSWFIWFKGAVIGCYKGLSAPPCGL